MGKFITLFFLTIFAERHATCKAASCSCDLKGIVCDTNCCCDPQCTVANKLAFSECIQTKENRIEKVCVSDSVLYSTNGKYQAEGSAIGLFCIFRDNYETRHFYSTVSSVTSQKAFNDLLMKYQTSTYGVASTLIFSYEKSFKAGDPLFVLLSDNKQGYISHPASFTSGFCEDSNEARFLESNTTVCSRQVLNLSSQCTSEKGWDAKGYAAGFKVAPFPSFILGINIFRKRSNMSSSNNSVELVSVTDPRLVDPTLNLPFKCKDDSGTVLDCPFTTLPSPSYSGDVGSGKCDNVVIEVQYKVNYTINTTVELSEVEISFVLGSISDNTQFFQQTHTMLFEEKPVGNITNTTVIARSGNPGYVFGLPVVSGKVFVDFATQSNFIAVNQERSSWFSTITSSSQGLCSTTSLRLPISFGTDFRSGCFIIVKDAMTLTECEQLQKDIYSVLLRDLPSHIASFGNSTGTAIDQWVAVINNQATAMVAVSNSQCGNMVTGVLFEFLFAKTGYSANPQYKIVGFQVKYDADRILLNQCNGLLCQTTTTRKVEITQAVSFIDVSSTPQTEVKEKPKFKSKAPNDFFYPFL